MAMTQDTIRHYTNLYGRHDGWHAGRRHLQGEALPDGRTAFMVRYETTRAFQKMSQAEQDVAMPLYMTHYQHHFSIARVARD